MDTRSRSLLDFIAHPESGGNYNAYYKNGGNQSIRLTDMTIGEVQKFQRQLAKDTGSSAAGRYQFLEGTLRGLASEAGLSMDTVFTEEIQDSLGERLLYRRGLDKFNSGQMTAAEFGNSLAKEWAGLPMLSGPKAGRSFYSGDAIGNAHGVSADSFLSVLSGQPVNLPASDLYSPPQGEAPFRQGDPANVVNIADINPQNPPSLFEQAQAAQAVDAQAANSQSMWEGVKDAVSVDWTGAQFWQNNFSGRPDLVPDTSFRMTSEYLDEVTKDIPEQYWDRFDGISSAGQGVHIRERILDTMKRERELAEMGGTGTALRLAAGFTDPVAWVTAAGITAGTAGLGAPAAVAARFGMAGRVALGAAEAGAGAAVAEGIMAANKPTWETSEGLVTIGSALVLGGALGPLVHKPAIASEVAQLEDLGRRMLADAANQAQPKGSMGAAEANVRQDLRDDISDIIRDGQELAPKAWAGKVRYDLSARLKQSDNTLTRMLGNFLVEDGTRNADGITPIGISEVKELHYRRADVAWRKGTEPAWKAYAKRTGGRSDDARHQFFKSVSEFVSNRDPMVDDFAPEVAQAGQQMRKQMRQWQEVQRNPGLIDGTTRKAVKGFDELEANDYYVPRIFDLGSISHHLNRFGDAPLSRMVAKAMQERNAKLTDEVADAFGRGYIKKLSRLSAGELQAQGRALSGEDVEGLKRLLQEETDMSPELLETVLGSVSKKTDGGSSSRAKSRLFYDDAFGAKLTPTDGTEPVFVRLSDLMVRDADTLMTMYNRQAAGRVALARLRVKNPKWKEGDVGDQYLIDGVTSDGDWNVLMDNVRAVGTAEGQKAADINMDIKRLQFTYDHIVGRPPMGDESTAWHQSLRILKDTQFLRVMGQSGFASLPEAANIASQIGLKAVFSNVPSFRSMWRNAKTGKLDDALAEEIEDLTTAGTDYLRHVSSHRLDDFDNPMSPFEQGSMIDKVDRFQQKSKKAMTVVSGLAPVNTMLHRVANRAIMQKFAIAARKGKLMEDSRMRALGLPQEMLDRIGKQINTHSSFVKGGLGQDRLEQLNFRGWDDAVARASFEEAVFRYGRSVVQENDIGNLAMWMNHNAARTFLQFRGFMAAGWSKQFLAGLNHNDWKTYTSFALSTFLASLTYVARTHLQSIGRPDREEWLKERLTVTSITMNGLQNSSWLTLGGPMLDTGTFAVGAPSLFTGRTTGLDANWLTGNPTVDFINKGRQLLPMPLKAVRGEFDQGDARLIQQLLPFQNVLGVSNISSSLIGNTFKE